MNQPVPATILNNKSRQSRPLSSFSGPREHREQPVGGITRLGRTLLIAVPLLLCGGACEEKKTPEHVLQRQRQERLRKEHEKRLEKMRKKAPPQEEDSWPEPVKQAYYLLNLAKGRHVVPRARNLAMLGADAAPALRKVATHPAHSPQKRMFASILLAKTFVFRPVDLAQVAKNKKLKMGRQAAIEALARLKNPIAEKSLHEVEVQLQKELTALEKAGSFSSPTLQAEMQELAGLLAFLRKKRDTGPKWEYTQEQLAILDQVRQAIKPKDLLLALEKATDRSLKDGLVFLTASPTITPVTQTAVAEHVVGLFQNDEEKVVQLLAPRNPPPIRISAAKKLHQLGTPSAQTALQRLAKKEKDPMSEVVQQILDPSKDPAVSEPRQQPPPGAKLPPVAIP